MRNQDSSLLFQCIIHGNVVVPTRNPFDEKCVQEVTSDEPFVLWLGPGLKLLLNHVLAVSRKGIIVHLAHESLSTEILSQTHSTDYLKLSRCEFLCPGFIDLHIHAPQFSYTGTATDRPLMGREGWLERYTFPAESSLKDLDRAQTVYKEVVQTTLNAGTTTAVYFATLDLEPTKLLVDIAMKLSQRALVGKVCMDRNSPSNCCHTLEENVQQTKDLVEYIHNKAGKQSREDLVPLVLPIVTPRFIPTCSPELIQGLGDLASQHDCHVQSHISESLDEVAYSRQLDSRHRSDAEIFDSHQLLTRKCIMAHGVHLSWSDLDLMKSKGSAVAHCPLSNFYFAGGTLPCRKLLERNMKVGLGTDVAGGYSPSMMNSARTAVVASHSLQQHSNESTILDYRHAFYLATLGGAEALGLQDSIGTLKVGMEFDALVLSCETSSNIHMFDNNTLEDVLQKLCTLGDDRNVKHVFVRGKKVKQACSS